MDDISTFYTPAKALGGTNATLANLINPILADVLIVSGIVAFVVIIIAGFSYISASGDKGKIEQAQNMLNYGIIGIIVVVVAFLATRLIGAVIGFKFF